MPIRDVRDYLEDARREASADELRVISRYSPTMCNLHKPFERMIKDAGFTPWPNLIKNLRLSCENDWLDNREAPDHVIAAWIGHSVEVQKSEYAIVSEGHFEQFNAKTPRQKSGAKNGAAHVRTDEKRQENSAPESAPLLQKDSRTRKKPLRIGSGLVLWRGLERM